MYKAHIRKALGTFLELQKPGKPHRSRQGEGHHHSSRVAGLGQGETFLCDCLIYFSLVPVPWCSPEIGWAPLCSPLAPSPHPFCFPVCSTFLLPGTLAILAGVNQKGEPSESIPEALASSLPLLHTPTCFLICCPQWSPVNRAGGSEAVGSSIQPAGKWFTESHFLPGHFPRGSAYFLFG